MAKSQREQETKPLGGRTSAAKRKERTFMGIRIIDPVVKPKGATVREIRKAVEMVRSKYR
jgi:hypothetical protein